MQTNERLAKQVAAFLQSAFKNGEFTGTDEEDIDFGIDEVSAYSEHYLSNDIGVFVAISDYEGRVAELGIRVQAYSEEPEFGEEEDED